MNRSLKKIFNHDCLRERLRQSAMPTPLITDEWMHTLPAALQRYLHVTRFVNRSMPLSAAIQWKNVFIKLAIDKKWTALQCQQFNTVAEPCRIAYMNIRKWGFPIMEGLDKYQDGKGSMHIKLLKYISKGNLTGHEMDQSALVTVLAESLILPGCLLQPYLQWKEIDEHTVMGTLSHGGISVSGSFHFNNNGQWVQFKTNDRWMLQPDGSFHQVAWSGFIDDYFAYDGLCLPGNMRAIWHTDKGDFEYFKGDIFGIDYDGTT